MILHVDSHTTHVPRDVLTYILGRFYYNGGFFKETIELPDFFAPLNSALYGPAMGDAPILPQEVTYFNRMGRNYNSRMIERPMRPTRILSVIAGPYKGSPCVLYTVFGGPLAPRELYDPALPSEEKAESLRFWSEHALSTHSI